jgi:hypothetical protein
VYIDFFIKLLQYLVFSTFYPSFRSQALRSA